ncbi:MAG: ectoine hydroxylase-related dioxygenase (phytanoyl-CoA dioxygenase family) [Rhodothermales bacterium]
MDVHALRLEILEPLIGSSIKQIANQIHWKHPGAKYTHYRLHQDMRFRERADLFEDLSNSYFTTGLAIKKIDAGNGGLKVFPGSHKLGYLGLSDKHDYIMQGQNADSDTEADADLLAAGLDPKEAVVCELEPVDLVIWGLLMVHGSGANTSDRNRPLILNSYVRASSSSQRGEWAFREGVSTPLGTEQNICRFEDFDEHPEPFYNETDWTGDQPKLT